MNKKIKTIIFTVFCLTLAVVSLGYFLTFQAPTFAKPAEVFPLPETAAELAAPPSPTAHNFATIEINGTKYQAEVSAGDSVYLLMQKLESEKKLSFTQKTYAGMGKLITSINGLRSNGENTWIFYLNGKQAEKGASSVFIKPGDVVSWKYEKVTYK